MFMTENEGIRVFELPGTVRWCPADQPHLHLVVRSMFHPEGG
jgi:hypothetical protein